jgi:DEAD/DEAH box helicase domain-containing protein
MGISVIGFGFAGQDIIMNCTSPRFDAFKVAVESADTIMGFNSKRFDDQLCAANGIKVTTNYDLLEEIRIAAYGSPHWEDQPGGFSYSLGAIASANDLTKTGSGTQAPKLWQQGMKEEVIDYCINDVKITKEIYFLGVRGELIDPNTGANLLIAKA